MPGPGTRTGLVSHERYFWHDAGSGAGFSTASEFVQPDVHPESPASKRRLLSLLQVSGALDALVPVAPRAASRDELLSFHTADYIERVRELSAGPGGEIGDSASISHGSYGIALLAAGGCIEAMDAILRGTVANAYALVRPPGHHAEADHGSGYCVFSNIVLAVRHAQRVHRVPRIAVVDWDVHHGNGTESAFIDDPSVLTISVHQDRCYPVDRGGMEVIGNSTAAHTNLNIPLPAGSGHGAYIATFERVIIPALRRFQPQLIVVASGLDASAMDPLGRMMATSDTYRAMTRMMLASAAEHAGGRMLVVHEGGYSNAYVPFCGLAVIEELAGIRTAATDPYLEELSRMAGHALLAHQEAVIGLAAGLAAQIPAPPRGS